MTSRSRTSLISARTQTTLCSRTFASTLSKAKRLEVERGSVGSGNQKTAVSTSRPMVSTNRLKERVAKLLQEMIESEKASDEYKALAQARRRRIGATSKTSVLSGSAADTPSITKRSTRRIGCSFFV